MKTYSNIPKQEELKIPVTCPVCKNRAIVPYRDYGTYSFQKCKKCSHIYQNPMPHPNDLENRYDGAYKDYEVENATSFLNLMLLGLKDVGFYELESSFPCDRSFLDIGCATGTLVEYMKNRKWTSYGLEICEEAAQYGRDHRGVDIFSCPLNEIPLRPESLDIIHASHVIEHVSDPREFMQNVYSLLKPSGYCIIVTPNTASLQEKLFKKEWRSAIADHVNLFSLKGLITLHKSIGFVPLKSATWGGLAAGSAPLFLKRIADRLIKYTPWGDVVILLSRKD